MADITEKVKEIVVEQLGCDPAEVTLEASFIVIPICCLYSFNISITKYILTKIGTSSLDVGANFC